MDDVQTSDVPLSWNCVSSPHAIGPHDAHSGDIYCNVSPANFNRVSPWYRRTQQYRQTASHEAVACSDVRMCRPTSTNVRTRLAQTRRATGRDDTVGESVPLTTAFWSTGLR